MQTLILLVLACSGGGASPATQAPAPQAPAPEAPAAPAPEPVVATSPFGAPESLSELEGTWYMTFTREGKRVAADSCGADFQTIEVSKTGLHWQYGQEDSEQELVSATAANDGLHIKTRLGGVSSWEYRVTWEDEAHQTTLWEDLRNPGADHAAREELLLKEGRLLKSCCPEGESYPDAYAVVPKDQPCPAQP